MTMLAPIIPLAPARLSTTMLCEYTGARLRAMRRAAISVAPPAGYPTTRRIGRVGYAALAAIALAASNVRATADTTGLRMHVSGINTDLGADRRAFVDRGVGPDAEFR